MNLTEVMYVTQAVKNLLIVSNLISKGATMGDTQDKMTMKKNGASMILDAIKGKNESVIFYLKAKRYAPEGKEAHTNIP